jgi:CBS domain containing-hemolysin-like protein
MSDLFRKSLRWATIIGLLTALMAMLLSVVSSSLLNGVPWSGGLLVVLVIVAINVVFDMLGTAAAAATERPFHAMAAKKLPGARHAIGILRRADQFSNFCNDVIGDICGIISGAAAFAVVGSLVVDVGGDRLVWDVLMVSVISALTVGWKALGKTFSIHYANSIIFQVGRFFFFLEDKFHIRLFDVKNNRKRKRGVSRAPRRD